MEENYDEEANNGSNLRVNNPLSVMQPGEAIICEIKRSPMGMLAQYISTGMIVLVLAAAAIFVPQVAPAASRSQAREFALLGWVVISALCLAGLYISWMVYYKNRWIVTDDSITQVNQMGLFNAQTSQLSMANLQDVTVIQDGVLCSMFNYGILRAETAGERSKFIFMYCPDPKSYAKKILMTREDFINGSPEVAKRANDDLVVPRGPSDGLSVR